MNPYGNIIETLQDWNQTLNRCGCCSMPDFPPPAKVCESVRADFRTAGFINPDDTEFTLYKKEGITTSLDSSGSTSGPDMDGVTRVFQTRSTVAEIFIGTSIPTLYEGTIGMGVCATYDDIAPVAECTATGSSSRNNFSVKSWGGDGTPENPANRVYGQDSTRSTSLVSVAGDQTEEHQQWEIDSTQWDLDHPDFPAETAAYEEGHAAWQMIRDEIDGMIAAYNAEYDQWIADGQIGDPPTEPEYPPIDDEPQPPTARPTEPEEFYPPCTYKVTTTSQVLAHSFGYFGDGSPAGEDEDPIEQKWFVHAADVLGYLDETQPGDSGATPTTEEGFQEPLSRSGWISLVEGLADAGIGLPNTTCAGTECQPLRYASPGMTEFEPPVEDRKPDFLLFTKINTRYSWRVPFDHKGSHYQVWWDIATEPTEGAATLEEDLTWQWTGPGTGEANDPSWRSEWYNLYASFEDGTKKVVNVRYAAYRSIYGWKPKTLGPAYVLPPTKPSVATGKSSSSGKSGLTGKSGNTGLKISGLKVGGLKMQGLRTGGLKIGGLEAGDLKIRGLRVTGLKSSSGLRGEGLKISGLKTSSLKQNTGLKISGLKSSTGIKVSEVRTSRIQGSSGLKSTGGLKRSTL